MVSGDDGERDALAAGEDVGDVIVEQEALKRHRAKLCSKLTLFFHTVDKFIMLLRVYPAGHQLIESFAEALLQQVLAYFEEEETLYVRVKARELLTEWGDVCFTSEVSEREHFVWYPAAIDGMLSFELSRGLTVHELSAFLRVINRAALGNLPLDDDTITLLWEYDLPHVETQAIEGFVDLGGDGVFGGLSEPEAKSVVMSASIAPGGEQGKKLTTIFEGMSGMGGADVFTRLQYQATPLDKLVSVPADVLADAFRVDTSWSRVLGQEWRSGDNLEYRLIESLLSIVRTSPGSPQSERAIQTISQIVTSQLDDRHYATASAILGLLKERRELFKGAEVDPIGDLLDALTDSQRIEALIYQAQKYLKERDAIIGLLRLFDADKVQQQVLLTLSTESKEVRAIDALIALLFAVTTKQNERNLLHDRHASKAIYFERLLPGLRGVELSEHPIAAQLLTRAMQHDTVKLRRQVLELADPSWCTSLVVEKYIKPRMSDGDAEVRQLAINAVRRLDVKSFEAWLDASMQEEQLSFRSIGEINFLIKLSLEQDARNIERLRGMIETRGWFSERRVTLARAAARALLVEVDAASEARLRALAGSVLTAPGLRKEYRALLERFAPAARQDDDTGSLAESSSPAAQEVV